VIKIGHRTRNEKKTKRQVFNARIFRPRPIDVFIKSQSNAEGCGHKRLGFGG
jgi:hypothetical protein